MHLFGGGRGLCLQFCNGRRAIVGFLNEAAALPLRRILCVPLLLEREHHVCVFLAQRAHPPPLLANLMFDLNSRLHRAMGLERFFSALEHADELLRAHDMLCRRRAGRYCVGGTPVAAGAADHCNWHSRNCGRLQRRGHGRIPFFLWHLLAR